MDITQPQAVTAGRWATRPWSLPAMMPTAVSLGIAVLVTLSWLQWWRPVIEHDDWDMLLPDGPAFVLDHAQRVLHEGRWLNYWSWLAGSQTLSPRDAVLVFAFAWLVVVAVFLRTLDLGWWTVPLGVAAYSAPMIADLAYWPATLAAPMAVLAIGLCLLRLTRERWVPHLVVVAATTVVTGLGYPPLALLVPVLLVAMHHALPWRRLLALAGVFVGAYIGSLVLIFALNDLRFGVFGLEIQSWRGPSSLNSLSALMSHLHLMYADWRGAVGTTLWPLLAAMVATVSVAREREVRRRLLVLVGAFVIMAGLSSASTITEGVSTPFRSLAWSWLCLLLLIAWATEARALSTRRIGRVAAVIVAVWASLYWAYGIIGHQRFEKVMDRIGGQVIAQYDRGHHTIVFAPRVSYSNPAEMQTAWQLGNALAKEDHVAVAGHCDEGCASILHHARARDIRRAVFLDQGTVIVRFPTSVIRTQLDEQPRPSWLVPLP